MAKSRYRPIKEDFHADIVVVCKTMPKEGSEGAPEDMWLVKSLGMARKEKSRMVVLLTQGETDAEDVMKCMELDVEHPASSFPNKERRQQQREMYAIAYPVLEDAKTQIFDDMRNLPPEVMDRMPGLLRREKTMEKLSKMNAQVYVRARPPKLKK